jgi:exosortase A-associated hydrolase 1
VVLWGLCDGASAALLYLHERQDPRVKGLVLLNPWVRSAATLARTHLKHYYAQRLLQGEFWRKLLRGGVGAQALAEFVNKLRASRAPVASQPASVGPADPGGQRYTHRMAHAWRRFRGPVLLLLSGRDYTAGEFLQACAADPAWSGALYRPGLTRHDLATADHTFSGRADHVAMLTLTSDWLRAPAWVETETGALP